MEAAAASIRTTKVISILKIISIFSYVIIQEFYSVASYTQVCDHLEIIFVKGIRSVCSFFFFCHLVKRLSLLHCIAFSPLSKSS